MRRRHKLRIDRCGPAWASANVPRCTRRPRPVILAVSMGVKGVVEVVLVRRLRYRLQATTAWRPGPRAAPPAGQRRNSRTKVATKPRLRAPPSVIVTRSVSKLAG